MINDEWRQTMENNISINECWNRMVQIIRENVDENIFKVWFEPIRFNAYDEQQKLITFGVPSEYVCHYLEQYHLKLLKKAIVEAFDSKHQLRYSICQEADFAQVVDHLKKGGLYADGQSIHISIPNARQRLEDGLRYFLGNEYTWLPCYERISDWLTDNKGRGLICPGTSGVGKTLICQRILPVLFGRNVVTVTAQEMNTRIDELLKERVVIIDDLGKEDVVVKSYGNRRTPFFELCDAAEKRGLLLIITTNLSTTPVSEQFRSLYPSSIEERYGKEVFSRLRATTRVVTFTGEDMRK